MQDKPSFREIRYKEKREKILENAARIFARKGYEGASLEEIAAKLQLTKASLYHYIKSKEEMLYLIQAQAIEQVQAALEVVINSNKDPVDKLKEAVKSHVKIVTQKHVIGALRQQELILPLKWRTKIIAQRDLYEETFQKIIKEGVETEVFKTKDWKMSLMAVLGALNWIVRWYTPQGKLSVKEIEEAMSDFILKGFGVN